MIKVGDKIAIGPQKYRRVLYSAVDFDVNGWADANVACPVDGDLMYIKVNGVPKGSGWCWGTRWEGLRLRKKDKVSHWKRNFDKEVMKNER